VKFIDCVLDVAESYGRPVPEVCTLDVRIFWRMYRNIPRKQSRETLRMAAAIGCAFDRDSCERMTDMAYPPEDDDEPPKTAAEENEALRKFLSRGRAHG